MHDCEGVLIHRQDDLSCVSLTGPWVNIALRNVVFPFATSADTGGRSQSLANCADQGEIAQLSRLSCEGAAPYLLPQHTKPLEAVANAVLVESHPSFDGYSEGVSLKVLASPNTAAASKNENRRDDGNVAPAWTRNYTTTSEMGPALD